VSWAEINKTFFHYKDVNFSLYRYTTNFRKSEIFWLLMHWTAQIIHLRAERDVLRMVNHPGLVNFLGGFQDENCVYFVMEYVCGGEFFRHLKAKEK
jgi:serine/threonine protein kinase